MRPLGAKFTDELCNLGNLINLIQVLKYVILLSTCQAEINRSLANQKSTVYILVNEHFFAADNGRFSQSLNFLGLYG